MRRIWGELVSIDHKTRTGTFRNEGTDEVMPFTVTPYAELLHHAARGDLQDFKVGERAIFRLHEDAKTARWVEIHRREDAMLRERHGSRRCVGRLYGFASRKVLDGISRSGLGAEPCCSKAPAYSGLK